MHDRGSFSPALLLVFATVLAYANGLTGDFTYDDKAIVRDNVRIQSRSTLGQIFETPYFGGSRGSGSAYRPLLLVSYAIQWWIHGPRPIPFHVVNLLIHLGVVLLLFRLFRRLEVSREIAFGAVLLFAVHPIHAEAVTSLVGRGETQSALFVLGYLHVALSGRPRLGPGRLAAALVLYLAALLTKESAAIAPALAFLALLRLERGGTVGSFRLVVRRHAALWAECGVVLAAVLLARGSILGGVLRSSRTGIFALENPLAPLPLLDRTANACLFAVRYLGRTLLPLRLSADESAWSLPPLRAGSSLVLAAVALLAVAGALSASRASRLPAFGFLFFAVALLPASNLLFPIGTIFAERLAYLPSVGVCLLASSALAALRPGDGGRRAWPGPFLLAVALLLAARTVVRNTVWSTDEALFANSVRTAPRSAKARYNLGYAFGEQFRDREALAQYARATAIFLRYWDAWSSRGRIELRLGLAGAAERSYRRSLAVLPGYENGYFGLGLVLERRGEAVRAEPVYREGLAKNPRSLPLAYRLAVVRSRLDRPDAEEAWRGALRIAAGSLPARVGYSEWLDRRGRPVEARQELREALARAPGFLPAWRAAADVNAHHGRCLAEGLARERIFRITRSGTDLALAMGAARACTAYGPRFDALVPRFERESPWAFPSAIRVLSVLGSS